MRGTRMAAMGAAAALGMAVAPVSVSWASGLPPVTVPPSPPTLASAPPVTVPPVTVPPRRRAAERGKPVEQAEAGASMPVALIPGLAAILVGLILLAAPDLRRRLAPGVAPRRRRRRRRTRW